MNEYAVTSLFDFDYSLIDDVLSRAPQEADKPVSLILIV